MLHHPFYPFATHRTDRFRHTNAADAACSEGLPLVTVRLGDTAAHDDPDPGVSPMHRPHVGCHVSRPMRPRICRKRLPVKSTSASWRTKSRACLMTRPPV